MADARNCRMCGRLFTYTGGIAVCKYCREKDEEDFKKVKDYLYENPGATLNEIASELNIGVKKIKYYLKEGRLEIINPEGNMVLECEKCGRSIKTGRYCDGCQKDITRGLSDAASQLRKGIETDNTGLSGMRYLYREEKK